MGTANRINQHKYAAIHRTGEFKAVFAIVPAMAFANQPLEVQKNLERVSEIKAALLEASIAFGVIPLELHARMVVHWPPFVNVRGTNYSTVTDFAKFLGLSTSVPRAHAVW
jgi:phosphoribosylpyrophosphate synthetase